MSLKLSTPMLCGSIAGAVLALGAALSASAQPGPDYGADTKAWGGAPYPAAGYGSKVGGVTVYATPHHERSFFGAPIDVVTASRVVPIGDLNLSTRWGVDELRQRVQTAAYDACQQLDTTPGLAPVGGADDVDCEHRAVEQAMAQAPVPWQPAY